MTSELLWNNDIVNRYKKHLTKKKFVRGSMFYCEKSLFDKISSFIQNNNYRQFLLINMYDTNAINETNSPVHFLERLFGFI